MPETPKGLDTVPERFTVGGVTFAGQLTIGAAKWLEKSTGKSVVALLQDLERVATGEMEIGTIALVLVALALSAAPTRPPEQIEADVDALTFPQMLEVLECGAPGDFEPKNSPAPEPPAANGSTGPSLNTPSVASSAGDPTPSTG